MWGWFGPAECLQQAGLPNVSLAACESRWLRWQGGRGVTFPARNLQPSVLCRRYRHGDAIHLRLQASHHRLRRQVPESPKSRRARCYGGGYGAAGGISVLYRAACLARIAFRELGVGRIRQAGAALGELIELRALR